MSRPESSMKLTELSYQEVIRKARRADFVFRRRTTGTHEIWWSENKRKSCVIPHHKEIRKGTLRSIIRQIGISKEEFMNL